MRKTRRTDREQALAILKQALVILQKNKWIKHHEAAIMNGELDIVSPSDARANAFCAVGALQRARFETGLMRFLPYSVAETYLDDVIQRRVGTGDNVVTFNDDIASKKIHVTNVYRRAIKKLELELAEEGA